QRHELGQQLVDYAELPGEREADRRTLGAEQQLFELAPDALGRQVVERQAPADVGRGRVDRQFEPCGELDTAQHTQAVVAECRGIDHPENTRLEIGGAAERIDQFAGQRIPRHRVDGEVAPACGFFERQVRVTLDGETPVPSADLRFAAGERDVDAADLVHREAFSHGVDAAEPFQ